MKSRGGKIEYTCPNCGSERIQRATVFSQKSGECLDCISWWPWHTRIKTSLKGATLKTVNNVQDGGQLLEIGDVVKYRENSGRYLRSGSEFYTCAVVVKTTPVVLASHEGDMRWETTVESSKLEKIGKVEGDALQKCLKRQDR